MNAWLTPGQGNPASSGVTFWSRILLTGLLSAGCITGPRVADEADGVQEALLKKNTEFRGCYERVVPKGLDRPEGIVVASFIVGPTGKAAKAIVQSTTLNLPKVEDCVISTIQGMMFPKPKEGGTIDVTFPFKFKAR